MTEDSNQESSNGKPIGHDHPLVDENELDNSPVDEKFRGNWDNIKNNPEAIVGFYKNYKNVPKEHREKAIEKIKNTDLETSTDFLVIAKSEREVDESLIQAYSIAVLDSFAARIQKKAQWLKSNVNQEESVPINSYPEELGHTVFELHASTVSFIESSCLHILKYKIANRQLPDRKSLVDWGSHKDRAAIDQETVDIESQEAKIFQWAADSGVHALSLALLQSGIVDDTMYQRMNRIREYRHDLLHRPATLTLKRFSDGETILDRAEDAIRIAEDFKTKLDQIPKHPVYEGLVEGQDVPDE
jgi:hypothetical protein